MTKKFMQSSSKKDKYDFFEKGTKIDVIKENYGVWNPAASCHLHVLQLTPDGH